MQLPPLVQLLSLIVSFLPGLQLEREILIRTRQSRQARASFVVVVISHQSASILSTKKSVFEAPWGDYKGMLIKFV
jgi:hypothetical protein